MNTIQVDIIFKILDKLDPKSYVCCLKSCNLFKIKLSQNKAKQNQYIIDQRRDKIDKVKNILPSIFDGVGDIPNTLGGNGDFAETFKRIVESNAFGNIFERIFDVAEENFDILKDDLGLENIKEGDGISSIMSNIKENSHFSSLVSNIMEDNSIVDTFTQIINDNVNQP